MFSKFIISLIILMSFNYLGFSQWAQAQDRLSIGEEAQKFPNQDYLPNQDILENERNKDKISIREAAQKFKNQKRPSTRDILRQQKMQDRLRKEDLDSDLLRENTDAIVISVSGVDEGEADDLMDVLEQELGYIKQIERVDVKRNLAVYSLLLKRIKVKQFAERLDGYAIGAFQLKLIRFTEDMIHLALE